MTPRSEPFTVLEPAGGGTRRWRRLADVIVTTAAGRPVGRQLADLFEAHPGLALALITAPSTATVHVASRDGRRVTVPARFPLSAPSLRDLAAVLYFDWVLGAESAAHPVPERFGSR
jgi:hypothetical protein